MAASHHLEQAPRGHHRPYALEQQKSPLLLGEREHREDRGAYVRSAQDVPYGVVLLTLYNNAGNPIGKVAMARDFSSSRAAAGRSLVWQALLALSGIVLLAGVVLFVVRGVLLRPLVMLSQQFAKLAEGRRDQPVPEAETLCDEMQALAKAHEQLRTKPQLSAAETDKKVSP